MSFTLVGISLTESYVLFDVAFSGNKKVETKIRKGPYLAYAAHSGVCCADTHACGVETRSYMHNLSQLLHKLRYLCATL